MTRTHHGPEVGNTKTTLKSAVGYQPVSQGRTDPIRTHNNGDELLTDNRRAAIYTWRIGVCYGLDVISPMFATVSPFFIEGTPQM